MRLLPSSATRDGSLLIAVRAVRGFSDGFVSILLAGYLTALGLGPLEVGAIVTGTLLGSAALTMAAGLWGDRFSRRRVLLAACCLMFATGVGFTMARGFWWLLAVAVVGTMNPSAGDVSVFLPTEQAVLAQTVSPPQRTGLFAWYNLAGAVGGALGALASALPVVGSRWFGWDPMAAQRSAFMLYALTAVVAAVVYGRLSTSIEVASSATRRAPLARSRRIVLHLAALFSLDSLGGGFVIQSLLVLWLYRRFDLSPEAAGAVFFGAGLLGAMSQLISARLAARIGLIRTMVYTHLPSNLLLILTAIMPTLPLALGCLLLRMAISQMDVTARQSYVMAVVPPEERAAASSVTNVPRSLAAALTPLLAGAMLSHSTFGWPLICAGAIKSIYDLLLLVQFRAVPPLDE